VRAFLTALPLLALSCPAVIAWAQAPDVPIESGIAISEDAEVLKRANVLREAGKLLDQAKVAALLKAPQPMQITLPTPATKPLPAEKLYQRAREAFVRVGWLYQDADKEPWQLNVAGGYAIADGGIVATAAHVLEAQGDVQRAFLLAMTADGIVLPVTSILAVDSELDAAIVRVEGFTGPALALNDNVSPGDSVCCFSDRREERGCYSTGIVSRFYWAEAEKGDLKTLRGARNLRFDVTTNWGPGSSGSAVLDRAGNAIGHAGTVSGVQYEADEEVDPAANAESAAGASKAGAAPTDAAKEEGKPGEEVLEDEVGSFQISAAVPARCLRLLVEELAKSKSDTSQPVAKIETDAPEANDPDTKIDAPSLKVGDPAPRLQCGKFVHGDPVRSFEQGKIYVVEFWATWCGPCTESIPHVSQLQTKYKDKAVVVIGQNCGEEEEEVAKFVKGMGDKMNYRVALDHVSQDEEGAMSQAWLQAAGEGGIPTAFVVDRQGKIAWIGHPMGLDAVLEGVVAGTFDPQKAAAEEAAELAAQGKIEEQIEKAMESSDLSAIDKLIQEHPKMVEELEQAKFVILLEKKDSAAVNALASKLIERQPDDIETLFWVAAALVDPESKLDKPDLDLALKAAVRANELTKGEDADILDNLARVHFTRGEVDKAIEIQTEAVAKEDDKQSRRELKKVLSEYEAKKKVSTKSATSAEGGPATATKEDSATKATATKDTAAKDTATTSEDAKAAIGRLLSNKEYKDNPHVLNLIAWTMVDPEVPFDKPDLDLALKVALRANELVKAQKSDILDTLARVYFVRGEIDKAIEIQTQSVAKAGPDEKQYAINLLSEYKAKKQGHK